MLYGEVYRFKLHFTDLQYNGKSCSRGMYSALEQRGERGMWACVFEEFILRCKESRSRIIDETCLLIMNLSSCYRPPLRKYYGNLSFLNYCFVKTLSQDLLCVYI